MKKSLFFAVIAALVMTGCSKDADVETRSSNAISFRAITGKNTRATEMTTSLLRNFRIYAYWDAAGGSTIGTGDDFGPNYMYGVNVSRPDDVTAFTYSPEQYWPSTGTVHFFAYSPSASTSVQSFNTASGSKGQPAITYNVAATAGAQEDLLYASSLNNKKATSGTTGSVAMNFDHALAQVIFSAKSGKESVRFEIEKIEILNVKSAGVLNLKDGAWSAQATPVTYESPLHATNKDAVVYAAGDNYVSLTHATDGTLMLLPQTLTAGTAPTQNDGTYIQVTYGAKDVSTDGYVIASGTVVTIPFGGFNLEKGKRYSIKLTMNGNSGTGPGGSELDPITFTADVNTWTDAASNDIDS